MTTIIIFMLITFRSHMRISDVTNVLIIFSWIKLLLKLPKFQTIQKCDRHFSVIGFAQMLKLNAFEGCSLQEVTSEVCSMVDCYALLFHCQT